MPNVPTAPGASASSDDDAASGRDDAAAGRDAASDRRDLAATHRDRMAKERAATADDVGRRSSVAVLELAEVRTRAADDRGRAAEDRRRATIDRRQAGADRARAAGDRLEAATEHEHVVEALLDVQAELRRANTDDLTGAYRRGAGQAALGRELARARREGERFVVAYIDVDGLKATNDTAGHAAGDARLRDVVSAIRATLRDADPIVRYGGDEFVCAVTGLDVVAVHERLDDVREALAREGPHGAMSFGLAELRPDDTLDVLVRRADAGLVRRRRRRT